MLTDLISLFTRDLGRLRQEISAYQQEENLWKSAGQISNSAGNLCLHLIGNLNTFIGKELGQTNYVRNRPLEFSQKNIPKQTLLQMIDDTIVVVTQSLSQLTAAALEKEYPVLVLEQPTTTAYMLLHLSTHLNYHLGQVNYHRRLLDQ